jgi:nucleotide-binding universal stress UspA family protein
LIESENAVYRKILLCYDGSAEGRNALKEGAEVALCMHAEAYLLAIIRSAFAVGVPEGVNEMAFRHEDSSAEAILQEGVDWLRERGLEAHGRIVFGNAIEQITQSVQQIQPDLIVVGHRRRSRLARWWSEGEDATLLERVSCSVLVAVAKET